MTPVAWMLVVVALSVGAGAGAWVARSRGRSRTAEGTLVPARTRQVLAAMPSGAVIIRRDRRNAYCNNGAVALGVARPDGALHPELARLAERAWGSGESIDEEIEVTRGVLAQSRRVHTRVTVIDDDLALALVNDNTEQHAAEQMRRNFAINVSHELKTPVGAIQLLAESVEAAADDAEHVRRFSGKLRKEAKRLNTLIQEIIEITRLQSDAVVLEHVPVRLSDVVAEAVDYTATSAQAQSITVAVDIRDDVTVLGSEDLLVMALRNLIDNAIRYSGEGKRVTVTCEVEGEVATLSVVDQGIGIADADTERIFDRFYRVDPARSRETGGTGLGLSIVKHIALRHDGAVEVWSKVGVGSTFALKLPVEAAVEEIE